jgi:hypothetical protein
MVLPSESRGKEDGVFGTAQTSSKRAPNFGRQAALCMALRLTTGADH